MIRFNQFYHYPDYFAKIRKGVKEEKRRERWCKERGKRAGEEKRKTVKGSEVTVHDSMLGNNRHWESRAPETFQRESPFSGHVTRVWIHYLFSRQIRFSFSLIAEIEQLNNYYLRQKQNIESSIVFPIFHLLYLRFMSSISFIFSIFTSSISLLCTFSYIFYIYRNIDREI